MKCIECNGTGKSKYGYNQRCTNCHGKGFVEPLTHNEWRRICSTEEFAEFLCEVWGGIDEIINIMSEDGEINKKDAVVKWLKQPHKKGNDTE